MRKYKNLILLSMFSVLVIAGSTVLADDIDVKIIAPSRDGVEVRKTYLVKGTATKPSGSHLWVLARREDFEGLWWPQGEGKVDLRSKEWKVSVTFGIAEDVGWNFDIAVIVVPESSHTLLRNYRINAMKTGDWRPIEMPEVLSAPVLRKVRKVSH